MKLEKKHYILIAAIVALILIFIYRKNLMRAMGFDESTIRKFCGGGALGYGRWFSPSTIMIQSTPPINEYTQSIYKITCEQAYEEGGRWYARCGYPGLSGNFYSSTGCAATREGAITAAIEQVRDNRLMTTSRGTASTRSVMI